MVQFFNPSHLVNAADLVLIKVKSLLLVISYIFFYYSFCFKSHNILTFRTALQIQSRYNSSSITLFQLQKRLYNRKCLSVRLSVCLSESKTPNQLEINHPSSSFIILHHPASSFIILHHPSSSFLHFVTFKLFSLF